MKKKILITGAGGYIGTELCNNLIKKNYNIIGVDTFWFGNKLNKKVRVIKSDIGKLNHNIFRNVDTVIHLAYLSSDPLCEINPKATWEIGPLSLYNILENCKKHKVKKFIFASSGSIYGIKNEKKVIEELNLVPLTDYNKSKMICEKVLETYKDKMKIIILRPGTVCGVSKRLRLDLLVNIFAYQAYFDKTIKVNGGSQIRPIINIKDMVSAYEFFLKKNISGTFNISCENKTVLQVAKMVKKIIPAKIKIIKNFDPRSYRMSTEKAKKIGFETKFSINDAIIDLNNKFKKGLKKSNIYWNIKWLLKNKFLEKN